MSEGSSQEKEDERDSHLPDEDGDEDEPEELETLLLRQDSLVAVQRVEEVDLRDQVGEDLREEVGPSVRMHDESRTEDREGHSCLQYR